MDTPKISVIVPIYKAEKYLHKCIDSILAQTFTDFELLLIDDGSPDNSGKICDEYAEKDSRIRVFHKENGGVSSARNMGLDNARGEWIAFVDADDWMSIDFLQFELNDSDIVEKSYTRVFENGKRLQNRIYYDSTLDTTDKIYRYFVNKRKSNALWNKFISRKLIDQKRFDENYSIGEDLLFFLMLLPEIKKYTFSSVGEYFYRIQETSAMRNIENNHHKQIGEAIKIIKGIQNLPENNIENVKKHLIHSTSLSVIPLMSYMNSSEKDFFIPLIDGQTTRKKWRIYYNLKYLFYRIGMYRIR